MDKAITEFKRYTNNYLDYGKMIDLKINHTLRVVDLSEKLAKDLNLSEKEIYISKIIGLLHDIGRFDQWKDYGTFKDMASIDHADLGVKILKKDNYIRKYIEDDSYDKIIFKGVKYHNKYLLPKNLTKKEELFCKMIRDVDKIDILYLYTTKEINLELDDKAFSKNVYNSLLNRKDIYRKDLKSKTDRLSISLGFIFDMNFTSSIKLVKDKKYFDTIIDMYKKKTKNKELQEQLEEIRKVINNYIEEMLVC